MRKTQNRESRRKRPRLSDFRNEVLMNNKVFSLLFLLAFSHGALAQNTVAEKKPQAYLLSGGETRSALSSPAKTVSVKTVGESKKDYGLERKVFKLINEQRGKLGLASLEWNDEIAEMARLHSENMANYKFFSHTGQDGSMVNDRADAFGIKKWRAIGENIAYNRGYENPAASAVERWMQSPAHRENLLNGRWKESGIGVAVAADGTYYFTEVFLTRK